MRNRLQDFAIVALKKTQDVAAEALDRLILAKAAADDVETAWALYQLVNTALIDHRRDRGIAADERPGVGWRAVRARLIRLGDSTSLKAAFARVRARARLA